MPYNSYSYLCLTNLRDTATDSQSSSQSPQRPVSQIMGEEAAPNTQVQTMHRDIAQTFLANRGAEREAMFCVGAHLLGTACLVPTGAWAIECTRGALYSALGGAVVGGLGGYCLPAYQNASPTWRRVAQFALPFSPVAASTFGAFACGGPSQALHAAIINHLGGFILAGGAVTVMFIFMGSVACCAFCTPSSNNNNNRNAAQVRVVPFRNNTLDFEHQMDQATFATEAGLPESQTQMLNAIITNALNVHPDHLNNRIIATVQSMQITSPDNPTRGSSFVMQ